MTGIKGKSGRKPKIDGKRTSIIINQSVYDWLNRYDNVSAEIECIASREMEEKAMKDDDVVYLDNPWSGATREMTWGEIKQWCAENVYPPERELWLQAALKAAENEDSKTLGAMIIGS